MTEKKECNVLLTAYSTIGFPPKKTYHGLSFLESKDHEIKNIEKNIGKVYTEFSFMDRALVTSESVLKYLILQKKDGIGALPIEIDKVFAFTTSRVLEPLYKKDKDDKADKDKAKEKIPRDFRVDDDKRIYKFNKNGKVEEFYTQQEFIQARLKAVYAFAYPHLPELNISWICINEEERGIEYNIDYIFKMIRRITAYIAEMETDGRKVNVYVDMTGGFRSFPMYLLFILNVLEKRGIEIKKILYSQMDYKKGFVNVDDLTLLLKTQNFTNGIHEFIKFGSAQELSEYLNTGLDQDTLPEYRKVIKEFVDTVENFAEAITISNRNQFEQAIGDIKATWMELEKIEVDNEEIDEIEKIDPVDEEDKRLEELKKVEDRRKKRKINLLKTFEPRIHSEYKLVWDNPNHLSYIKWCRDHNFIQQALTLYIELIPEILFEKNEYGSILECIDEKALRKSYDGGVYKFEYSLLNQADLSVESRKHDLITHEEHDFYARDFKICETILKGLITCRDSEWIKAVHKRISENTVEEFFVKAQEKFKSDKEKKLSKDDIFSIDNIAWKRGTLDESMFKKNWSWIIFSLTNLESLANLYEESLDSLLDVLKKSPELKGLQGEIIVKKIGSICCSEIESVKSLKQKLMKELENIKDKECIDEEAKDRKESIEKELGQLEEKENKLNIALFGYVFLQNECTNKVKELLREKYLDNAKNQNINHFNTVKSGINELKKYIQKLKQSEEEKNKKENREGSIHELKSKFIKVDSISFESLAPILLPYTVNRYHVSGHSKFDNKIEELDKRFKIDDIQVMIDGDIDGKKKKLKINDNLRKALQNGKMQLQPSSKALSIIKDSVEINKLKEIEERYSSLFPACMGGTAPELDMWNRDNLSLLILRILLYPYHTLKLIRNDSVHAREERQFNVSRKDIKDLITSSIDTIESYLEMCKITEVGK